MINNIKEGKCLFDRETRCIGKHGMFVCRNCDKVPDFRNIFPIDINLEELLEYAICESRRKRENIFLTKVTSLPKHLIDGRIPCQEHGKLIKYDGDWLIILDPYIECMESIEELISFCKKHGVRFDISGASSHKPGDTFRIYIYDPDRKKAYHKIRCLV